MEFRYNKRNETTYFDCARAQRINQNPFLFRYFIFQIRIRRKGSFNLPKHDSFSDAVCVVVGVVMNERKKKGSFEQQIKTVHVCSQCVTSRVF